VLERHLRALPPARQRGVRERARRYLRGYLPRLRRDCDRLNAAGDWAAARLAWRSLVWLEPAALRRPRVLANVVWGLVGGDAPPPWWPPERLGRACGGAVALRGGR
jgi:hypothetical protein